LIEELKNHQLFKLFDYSETSLVETIYDCYINYEQSFRVQLD